MVFVEVPDRLLTHGFGRVTGLSVFASGHHMVTDILVGADVLASCAKLRATLAQPLRARWSARKLSCTGARYLVCLLNILLCPDGDHMRIDTKSTRSDSRERNRRFVLQRIYSASPTTRAEISRDTGLTAATISDLVASLIEDRLVVETGMAPSSGGKPPVLLDMNADAMALVTIDVSGSRWVGSVRNLRHEVLRSETIHGDRRRGDDAVAAVLDLIDELAGASASPVLGVGVGTPGVVTGTGIVVEAPNLGWSNLPLADILSADRDWPVHVLNDARATAMAEFLLGEHGTRNLFVIKIGRGVGSGIILDSAPYVGESFAAGEIGHIKVIPRDGSFVSLESVANTPALAQALADHAGVPFEGRPSKFIAAQAAAGAPGIEVVAEQLGRDLGVILASVAGTLDIHHIVLSGPIAPFGERLLRSVTLELEARLLPAVASEITVSFGDVEERNAVEIGVATHVLNMELGVV
jgi:predicted NBD/HSP70 family sugar kinase